MPDADLIVLAEQWGQRLRKRRKSLDVSVADLAQTCGISRQTIHYYEAGDRVPRDSVRIRLAAALSTTVPDLFPHHLDQTDAA